MADITHIGDLTPDPQNARQHTPRNVGMIEDALNEVGAARSIVIDEDGVVLAGNATIEAAAQAGIERVQVVEADGETIVAVKRSGLTDEQKKRLALFDNRASELATWDVDQLLAEVDAGFDFDGLFYEDELSELLADVMPQEPPADPGAQVDRAAELQEVWQVERGQVWEVESQTVAGKCHRVMCGDSTSAEDVAVLMGGEKADAVVTDPPYGVDYDGNVGGDGKGTIRHYPREKLKNDDTPNLYSPFLTIVNAHCADHVALYLFYADGDAAVTQAVTQAGFIVRNTLIWNKNLAQYGALSAQYKQKHEPFLYCHLKGKAPRWAGPTNEVTVWDVDRANANKDHPTQKPPELIIRALKNSTHVGDAVADGFLGSGTTLVACEQTGRVGYGMEIEPKYVAVTLQRLADMGLDPRLVE